MKCSVSWCSDQGDPYFGYRCTEHTLEWLGTLSPAARDEALGPPMGFPKVLRTRGAGSSGKFIFLERDNGDEDVSGLREGLREQVAIEAQAEVR
jgi:hypothetical protein